jgi:hypothetical protein
MNTDQNREENSFEQTLPFNERQRPPELSAFEELISHPC